MWGLYATYKQYEISKNLYGIWLNCLIAFFVNFLLFPYTIFIAIKNKKLTIK